MRVVHVCCTDNFAGVERHVADLAATQARCGDDVTVLGGNQARMRQAVADAPVVVRPADGVLAAVRRLARLERPDVVHVHMSAAEVAVAATWPLRSTPVVATRHFAAARGARRSTRSITSLAARRITAEIAVSHFVADHMEGPAVVVHAGVPSQPDTRPPRERSTTLLVAQRLEPEEQTDLAVEAFARSDLHRQGWRLEVLGDGSERARLERLAADLGVAAATTFEGSRSDVSERMQRCGVYLASRGDEAYGLSVLEAMATGAPVVAAGAGGHLETVGSVPGAALFPAGDCAGAARVLRALADDEARRGDYGLELQRAQRERFSLDRQRAETSDVYRSVL